MFIGRKRELETLNKEYNTEGFRMTILMGRRRIGKSTLIREFIKDKKAIYYTATKVGAIRNLDFLSQQVLETLNPNLKNLSFQSIEDLFDFMTLYIKDEKLVFVIDELPYWAIKDEGLLSVLQKYIDNKWLTKNLYIILCGSSLSFMENQVLSEKSPLFGRKTSQIKLEPFNYLEAAQFMPNYSNEEKAICYGITGGIANYLSMINPNISLDENIIELFFHPNGDLYDEPRNLLAQEFNDISLYNNIIEQIANGQNTFNVIVDKVHDSNVNVNNALKKLMSIHLIEKKHCITEEKNKKKTSYVLKDTMFKFWYRYIPKACSVIEMEKGEIYYNTIVKPDLHSYMGPIFEQMCQWFTLREGIERRYNSFITQTGSWWGVEVYTNENGKKITQPCDIDVVGISDLDKSIVVGECKFKNQPIDKKIYEVLVRRSKSLQKNYTINKYLFFSLSGYTNWFHETQDEMIVTYTLDDLYKK